MSRLERKCLLASAGMHALLLALVIFGTAFIVPTTKRPLDLPAVKVVPTRLIDQALAGGGGNPNLPPSDAQQKGNTLKPLPTPPPQPPPKPPQPQPAPAPPPAPPQTEARKAEPIGVAKKPTPKPAREAAKPSASAAPKTPNSEMAPISLKPVVRSATDKEAARAEAEAREWAATSQRIGKQIGRAVDNLRSGFEQGTVVEASGPGGEAYLSYAAWVKKVYEDAWIVTDSLVDDDGTARVVVTIARDGRVISAYIDRRSGNTPLDRSVQRAIDRVKFVAPFPEGAREDSRSFTINFNLKAKRLSG